MSKKKKKRKTENVDLDSLGFWFRRNFDNKNEEGLEEKLGYTFKQPELLVRALIHSSFLNGMNEPHYKCNERLEFLGDAVCNMLVTEYLYNKFPEATEGQLTNMKGAIVSGHAWAQTAALWNLGKFVRVDRGVATGGGRYCENIVADAFEAVLGAVYLDGGLQEVLKIMERFHWPRIPEILSGVDFTNFKSLFLEYIESPEYVETHGQVVAEFKVINETGPDHERIFTTEVFVNGVSYGVAEGASKKKSEQEVSRIALEKIKAEEAAQIAALENAEEFALETKGETTTETVNDTERN